MQPVLTIHDRSTKEHGTFNGAVIIHDSVIILFVLRMLLPVIECESECNVFVVVHSLFVFFALFAFLSLNITHDPVSIPIRMGTVVVQCII